MPPSYRKMKATQRRAIHQKGSGRCWYCGDPVALEDMHVDHMVPRIEGGTSRKSNLVPTCPRCNMMKGRRNVERFRIMLARRLAGIPDFTDEQASWLMDRHGVCVTPEFHFWFELMDGAPEDNHGY